LVSLHQFTLIKFSACFSFSLLTYGFSSHIHAQAPKIHSMPFSKSILNPSPAKIRFRARTQEVN